MVVHKPLVGASRGAVSDTEFVLPPNGTMLQHSLQATSRFSKSTERRVELPLQVVVHDLAHARRPLPTAGGGAPLPPHTEQRWLVAKWRITGLPNR